MRRFKAWLFLWLCSDLDEQVKLLRGELNVANAAFKAHSERLDALELDDSRNRKPPVVEPKVLRMRNFADFQRVMTPSEDQ